MEIIGGIASISQVACIAFNLCQKIHAIRSELRDAPKRIKRQEAHLISLLHIVQSMKKSYVCYPITIGSHLNRIQEIISALQKILVEDLKYLKKEPLKRVWRAILIIRSEGRILTIFDSLEAEKSSLLLVLAGNQGEILQEIRCWTEKMAALRDEVPFQEAEKSSHEGHEGMQLVLYSGEQCDNRQKTDKAADQATDKDMPKAGTKSSGGTSNTANGDNNFKNCSIEGEGNGQTQGNCSTGGHIRNRFDNSGIKGNNNRQAQGNMTGRF